MDLTLRKEPADCNGSHGSRGATRGIQIPEFRASTYLHKLEYFEKRGPKRQFVSI